MNKAQLLTAAATWHEKNVSIVPVRYMSKRPLVKWTPWINKTQPASLIDIWFRKNYPCNIGIVLSGGLTLVDFDHPLSYANWILDMPHLKNSLTVKTGRGWHVYLQIENWKPHTYVFDGGEIKCNGIAVVPPSIHPHGHEYRFMDENASVLGRVGVEDIGVKIVQEFEKFKPYSVGKKSNHKSSLGTVQRIKDNIDIALWLSQYTQLRQNDDGTLIGACPFHNDNSPSFVVYPDEGRCYCHSPHCVAHGYTDVISAAAYKFNISMERAVYLLASTL